jgi:hypothetical protein
LGECKRWRPKLPHGLEDLEGDGLTPVDKIVDLYNEFIKYALLSIYKRELLNFCVLIPHFFLPTQSAKEPKKLQAKIYHKKRGDNILRGN